MYGHSLIEHVKVELDSLKLFARGSYKTNYDLLLELNVDFEKEGKVFDKLIPLLGIPSFSIGDVEIDFGFYAEIAIVYDLTLSAQGQMTLGFDVGIDFNISVDTSNSIWDTLLDPSFHAHDPTFAITGGKT